MIICVGGHAAGKSTFYRRFFSIHDNYKRINYDNLRDPYEPEPIPEVRHKATSLCTQILSDKNENGSIIIDNCNATRKERSIFIKIAQKCGIKKIRCLNFQTGPR